MWPVSYQGKEPISSCHKFLFKLNSDVMKKRVLFNCRLGLHTVQGRESGACAAVRARVCVPRHIAVSKSLSRSQADSAGILVATG
jgi:hypothetical protein